MQMNNRLLLKVLELVIAIICIVLFELADGLRTNPMIVCTTIGGFTIICAVILIGHFTNSVFEKRLNGLIAIIGCVLFLISGALVINRWSDSSEILFKDKRRYALSAGSLMIINAVVFLVDAVSIFRS